MQGAAEAAEAQGQGAVGERVQDFTEVRSLLPLGRPRQP